MKSVIFIDDNPNRLSREIDMMISYGLKPILFNDIQSAYSFFKSELDTLGDFIVVIDLLMESTKKLSSESGSIGSHDELTGLYLAKELVKLNLFSKKQLSRFCFYTSHGSQGVLSKVRKFSEPYGIEIFRKSIGDPSKLCIPMINKLEAE